MQKLVQKAWQPLPLLHWRKRDEARGRRLSMTRFPGRLNLFQTTMLGWRDLHPYNAVHAVRIARPLDPKALETAIDDVLSHAGLTGLELDRTHHRYAWRGGAPDTHVEVVVTDSDWQTTLAMVFERHLNQAFGGHGAINPFRFTAVNAGSDFFLALAYDHFIAGGDSIVVLLNAICDRYAGYPVATAALQRYPRTHWRLFVRHPWRFVRALGHLPGMAASCRRTIRPQYRSLEDGHDAFTFFTLEPAELSTLRTVSKDWGVTLNDTLMALLLLAQDAQTPQRDRSGRRHELAVASIMNLRDAHGEDARRTFGQFLSSFRVSHPVPPGITLYELARDVHRATTRIKREKLFLTTLFAMSVDRAISHFQTERQRMGIYAKSYPVGAGISSLNVNALWHSADGGGAPLYIRGVPTGPASPIVVAVTTSGDMLCAGVSYRTSAVGPDDIARIQAHVLSRIHALT